MQSIRQAIQKMSAYLPGEKAADNDFIILNANENPYPPSPAAIIALKNAIGDLSWYPESFSVDAQRAAAEIYGVTRDMVMLTNSSDEMLRILMQACVNDGDLVYAFTPSFTFYQTLARVQNADFREIEFPDDFSLPPLPDLSRAKLVFFPNPAAPSGTVFSRDDLRKILANAKDTLVVIDEAYADFDENKNSAMPLLNEYKNLVITRTFSKSYSLAGLRLGWGLAAAEIMHELHKVRDYYNVDRLAQAVAAAALRDQQHLQNNCAKIIATRKWFSDELAKIALKVWSSGANFVLARFGKPTAEKLYQQLKTEKILVRYWNLPRLDDCLRITIGTDEQMQKVIMGLKKYI